MRARWHHYAIPAVVLALLTVGVVALDGCMRDAKEECRRSGGRVVEIRTTRDVGWACVEGGGP